jgi:hypothetical protein
MCNGRGSLGGDSRFPADRADELNASSLKSSFSSIS